MTPQRKDGFVMKRTLEMKIRFTKNELDHLGKKARKAGLSRESFCRRALNGVEVKEAPPADLPVMIQEIRHVGSCLDQLLKRASNASVLEASQLREAMESNRAMEKLVVETYTTRSD